jgi:hypothetical protein
MRRSLVPPCYSHSLTQYCPSPAPSLHRLPEEEIEEKLAAYRAELLAKFAAAQPSKEK